MKNKLFINAFCYESKLTYLVHISDQKSKNSTDFLIIPDKIKLHVYIKDFNKFMLIKTKNKNKKYFKKYCLQCFSSDRILVEHKNCLKMNGKQTLKLKSGFVEFKNYSRQIQVPFKIYTDFKCILKVLKATKKQALLKTYQDHIPFSFAYRLVCVLINLANQLFFTGIKM